MKKKILFISLITLCFGVAQSQQVPQFSQNMFNKLANNPAIAGSSESINTTVLHRSQWVGFDGAPTTLNLAVDAPVEVLHGGIGLNIFKDNIQIVDDKTCELTVDNKISITEIINRFNDNNIKVIDILSKRNKLEELFIELTQSK